MLGRQRASRELGERAGRAVRLVEVEDDLPVLGHLGVEEAPSRVGPLPRRLVGEDEEQLRGLRLLEDGIERDLAIPDAEQRAARNP